LLIRWDAYRRYFGGVVQCGTGHLDFGVEYGVESLFDT
jgi:hypothetical protein